MPYGATFIQPLSQNGLPVARACYVQASACLINVSYFDTSDAPYAPTKVRYRIDDVATGVPIVPWTVVSPVATTNQITVTSLQNQMVSVSRPHEIHQIGVEVTDANGNLFYTTDVFLIQRFIGAQNTETADSDSPSADATTPTADT